MVSVKSIVAGLHLRCQCRYRVTLAYLTPPQRVFPFILVSLPPPSSSCAHRCPSHLSALIVLLSFFLSYSCSPHNDPFMYNNETKCYCDDLQPRICRTQWRPTPSSASLGKSHAQNLVSCPPLLFVSVSHAEYSAEQTIPGLPTSSS